MIPDPLSYCLLVLKKLKDCSIKDYSCIWVNSRMEFCRTYCKGFIFSNRFGLDFFEKVAYWLSQDDYLYFDKMSEYDKNFNRWLKQWRLT